MNQIVNERPGHVDGGPQSNRISRRSERRRADDSGDGPFTNPVCAACTNPSKVHRQRCSGEETVSFVSSYISSESVWPPGMPAAGARPRASTRRPRSGASRPKAPRAPSRSHPGTRGGRVTAGERGVGGGGVAVVAAAASVDVLLETRTTSHGWGPRRKAARRPRSSFCSLRPLPAGGPGAFPPAVLPVGRDTRLQKMPSVLLGRPRVPARPGCLATLPESGEHRRAFGSAKGHRYGRGNIGGNESNTIDCVKLSA